MQNGPLPTSVFAVAVTPTAAAFSGYQTKLSPAQRAAFEFPETADAAEILDEVCGKCSAANPARARVLEALRDPEASNRVHNFPGLLTAADCLILRQHCDNAMADAPARDSVDGLPDFQINLGRWDLGRLLNFDVVQHLCAAENEWLRGKQWERIGIFVRRYSPSTRPCFPFHKDSNAYTANIALSNPTDHQGGTLLCLVSGAVRTCERGLGVATVHGNDVLHAVTPVTAGTRYSLLIFFHERVLV
jgi:hypothetical protein